MSSTMYTFVKIDIDYLRSTELLLKIYIAQNGQIWTISQNRPYTFNRF